MVSPGRKKAELAASIDAALFREPLDLLYAEHYRQRIICNTLDAACGKRPVALSRAELRSIVEYLTIDLPLHIADEEEALFPLLEARCTEEDSAGDVIELLRAEHAADQALMAEAVAPLRAMAGGRTAVIADTARAHIRAMAEAQRRHLAWENSVVLPLAKRRLTDSDLVDLGRAMAQRRGITV
jgi:hemerythrin-like domain-containing protein